MTIQEAMAYIHTPRGRGAAPRLARIQRLLAAMGDPQKELRFVHIAGTNGKGSTAAMVAAMLQAAGYTVGLFTSPFIFTFGERIQVNGVPVGDGDLAQLVEEVRPLVEAMAQPPTEFELVTALAMAHFRRCRCHVVVLEAGLGGALDATNVIASPLATVLTNIGLDHTEILGNTLAEIARAKCGIIKAGTVAVTYPGQPPVEGEIARRCRDVGAVWRPVDPGAVRPLGADLEGQTFSWKNMENLHLPLLGAHQLCNAAVALTAVEVLGERGFPVPEAAVRAGLAQVSWPCRFQVVARDPVFIVDGGHNPQCVEALVDNVRAYLSGRRLVVLTGVLADKDYAAMYGEMARLADAFVTVTPPSPRALPAEALAVYLRGLGCSAAACAGVPQAVAEARRLAGPSGAVLAYGSLYMAGAVAQAAGGGAAPEGE